MKYKDIASKSPEELSTLVNDLKAELFTLRFKNKTGQLDQSHKIKVVKKDIAKVFTALKIKEMQKTSSQELKEGKA